VPETSRHLKLRVLLLALLEYAYADRHSIGSDQFIYWHAADPKRCLAPDIFVRLGTPQAPIDSWKVWERGAPELAVEVVSEFDRSETSWEKKLARYHELGVRELIRFDPDGAPGSRIRAWDRLEGDLVERIVDADVTACHTLALWWHACPAPGFAVALRLAPDEAGQDLLPTPDEAAERARDEETRARVAAERSRDDEMQARVAAERELAAARAEIERLRGGR
jgi:hypothetical protein